jgi:DNA polymerase-1
MAYDIHQDVQDILDVATMIPGVYYAQHPELEADDLLYSLAKKFEKSAVEKVYIYSGDDDLLQAVSEKVVVIRKWESSPRTPLEVLGISYVKEKYGVSPDRFPFYKMIVGDTSDNIPGLPRFPRLLLQQICNDCDALDKIFTWTGSGLSKANVAHVQRLREEKSKILRNYCLVKLNEVECAIIRGDSEEHAQHCQELLEKWQIKSVPRFLERFASPSK